MVSSKRKELAPNGSRQVFRRFLVYRKANRKSQKNVFLMINNKSLHGISSPLLVVLINVAHSLEISVPRSKPAVLSGTISGANWDKNMPF